MKVVFHKNSKEPFNLYRYLTRKGATRCHYQGDFILFGRNYENYHIKIEKQVYLFTLCVDKPYTFIILQLEGYPEVTDNWYAYHYLQTGEVRQPNFDETVPFHYDTEDLEKDDPVYIPNDVIEEFRCDEELYGMANRLFKRK